MRANVPSLRTFLEILTRNGPEYNSNNNDYYGLPRMCYHINGKDLDKEVPKITPPDQSPYINKN